MSTALARRTASHEFRRAAVLDAAAEVFARAGLEGATMRAIAEAAGYSAAALYAYYPAKEAIYADLLAQSLDRLRRAVNGAIDGATDDEARMRAGIAGFLNHYRDHPRDLELGLYLFQGLGPHGLSPAHDRDLNNRLIAVLRRIADTIARFGRRDPLTAHGETVSVFAHLIGILVAERTGRLKTLDARADDLLARFLDGLVARLRGGAESAK
ncbi:MAG: TetR family transcriptional regulator [Alphaproteobacteria bacterium]|nr:TetR family transcriptional regulator [Alphaproteobacteria bacterium]